MRFEQRAGWACLGAVTVLAALGTAPASAAPVACSVFKASFLKATSDLKSDFVRPLIVSRGGPSKDDVFDLVSSERVDGVLTCRGETLERFEAKIPAPAPPGLTASFEHVQKAAMMAAFKWPQARADSATRTINTEAAEYLRASIQRGDVVLAGKTEYHEAGGDLGMMWTPTQQTFVVVGEE